MWNYDNSLNNSVEGIILTQYPDKYSVHSNGLSEACVESKFWLVAVKFGIVKTGTTIVGSPRSHTI